MGLTFMYTFVGVLLSLYYIYIQKERLSLTCFEIKS
jgi:hypothetical protein